jgi:sugar lactone lactonase YvrE
MRYFKFVICAAILLFVSGAASAQQDYINTFAGGGPNNVPAATAPVYSPSNVAVDSAGNFYFSTDGSNYQHRVWKVTLSTGILTIVAGTYYAGYSGDGGPATLAQLNNPQGIALDHNGNLFIADESNCAVREVNVSTGIINTIAGEPNIGCGYLSDGVPATSTYLYEPTGVAIDTNGNLFIADWENERIRMVSCATVTSTGGACSPNAGQTAGDIYTVAGTGTPVFSGDGGLATSSNLYLPYGVAVDTQGNLYIGDEYDHLVRRVACGTGISGCTAPSGETSGHMYTIAGNGQSPGNPGTCGYNSDGITAVSAELCYPTTVTIDNSGNLFIADTSNFRIREVSCVTKTSSGGTCTPSTGQTAAKIYTAAGSGNAGYDGDGSPATSTTAYVYYAYGVAVDSKGDLFIADTDNDRIREVPCDVSTLTCTPPAGDTAQYIYTVAGTGTTSFFGENIPATGAELQYPTGTASDSLGNTYIADRNNCVVRVVNSAGNISTFAGVPGSCGYNGDAQPATSAYLYYPYKVAVDSSNNVYISDTYNCVVREVSGGTINTIAGTPEVCGGALGDGGSATSASLYYQLGITLDSSGNLYIADQDNEVIRKVSGGNISTIAGNNGAAPNYGFAGDGGPATSALLYNPTDVAVDSVGNVYIADSNNYRIREVNTLGIMSTYAGNGSGGYQGDGGFAVETSLYQPQGVAVDAANDVLIADYYNERVRLVDGAGYIHTIAGNGTAGFIGQDVLATTAELYYPIGVSVDPSGNIFVADYQNWLIRKINALAELNGSPSSVVFDTQLTGTTSGPVTLTLTGAGAVTITSITPSANFSEQDDCGGGLSNGQTCTVDVYFSPTSAGIINGTLTVADNAFFNSPLVISLRGTATDLTITPNPLNFSVVQDGTPSIQSVTITGSTTYAATSATLTGDTTDYTISSNTCTGLKASCAIGITFNPGSAGPHNATLWIHDSDPTSAQAVSITGSGCVSGCSTAYETFTPNPVNFGSQTKGVSSAATKVTFTNNNSSGSLTITKPVASTGFKVNTTGLTAPLCSTSASTVVAAGASCSFNVVFDPTVTGSAIGTVKTTFPNDGHGNVGLTLNVTGEGSATSFTPSPVAFKAQKINTTSAKTKVTLKNVDAVSITLSSLVSSQPAVFVLSNTGLSPACSLTSTTVITAGSTCVFDVAFAPGASFGTITGTITANYTGDPNGDTSHVLNVSGIGTEMTETGSLAFGTVANPSVGVKSVTVTNAGTTSSTITTPTITGTGAAEYSILPYNGTNSTCLNGTVVLTASQHCTLTVQFTPPVGSGTNYTASLNINSTGGGPLVVAISGKN